MAWIKIYQSLRDNHKVLDAADSLGIDPAHMIGILVSFWTWALDNAPAGSLAGVGNRTIARAAQWSGSPEQLIETLVSQKLLDRDNNGDLAIHNWSYYTGKMIEEREKERLRSAQRRAQKTAGFLPDDRKKTESANRIEEPVDRKTTVGRVEKSRVEYSRVDNNIYTCAFCADEAGAEDEAREEDHAPEPPETRPPSLEEKRFAVFWEAYPKKKSKQDAWKAFRRISPNEELFDRMMSAITKQRASPDWTRDHGKFIPYPATWLNRGCWDDEIQEVTPNAVNRGNIDRDPVKPTSAIAGFKPADG